jgi:hypothetical protein
MVDINANWSVITAWQPLWADSRLYVGAAGIPVPPTRTLLYHLLTRAGTVTRHLVFLPYVNSNSRFTFGHSLLSGPKEKGRFPCKKPLRGGPYESHEVVFELHRNYTKPEPNHR